MGSSFPKTRSSVSACSVWKQADPHAVRSGNSLVNLGRAHSTVAELQQTFGHQFKDTFIAAIEQFKEEIKEYEGLRKQLDTRRYVGNL